MADILRVGHYIVEGWRSARRALSCPGAPRTVPMSKILTFKKPTPKEKNRGKTLCLHDFHKWKIVTERKFDVKQGRLVTLFRCERCGKEKTEAR